MGPVILNIVGLVETVFSPIMFKRLRGKHDPICIANDPEFPRHKEAPLDEPVADDVNIPEVISSASSGSVEQATTRDAPSISDTRCGENRRSDPELPKPPPCPIIDEIFEKLSTNEGKLYVDGMWSGWPDTSKPDVEGEVCEYLNEILARVRKYLYGSEKGPEGSTEWIFSVVYAKKDERSDRACRKPCITLIPSESPEVVKWESIRSVGEVRSRHQSDRKLVEGRLTEYSRLMYGDDCARRFALLFSLIRDEMVLFRYDRAGILGSNQFNVHKDPKNFLRVIVGLGLGEDFFIGLDPSFFFKGPIRFVRLNDKEYEILEVLCIESVIRGRGTVVLRVLVDPGTGREGVIKEQWVDKAQRRQEIFWLLYLARHGAKNIATVEDHQLIRFKVGEDTVVDETSALRSLISGWDVDDTGEREHRRVLITPVGKLLKHFGSLKELVSVFKDFAEGILSIYRAKVYHRDISRYNLVIVRKEDERIGKGYVIDFDCAAFVDNGGHAEVGPIGTVPFMAESILINYGCPHKYYYELESLFYTLIWTCLMADGPRDDGCPKPTTDFRKTELRRWYEPKVVDPEVEKAEFRWIAVIRYQLMKSNKEFERGILSRLSSYFNPVRGLLEELRGFLFRPEMKKIDHLTPDKQEEIQKLPEHVRLALGLVPGMEPVQDREPEEAMQSFIDILDRTLNELETGDTEGTSGTSASSCEQEIKDVTDDPKLDDMERTARCRRCQVQGQKEPTPPEDNLADKVEGETDTDNNPEGEVSHDLGGPAPCHLEGSQTLNPLALDRQSGNSMSSGSRTAVSMTVSTSISVSSKTAASPKAASLTYKDEITSSRRHGTPRGQEGQSIASGSQDIVRSKRTAPEPEQFSSPLKRQRR